MEEREIEQYVKCIQERRKKGVATVLTKGQEEKRQKHLKNLKRLMSLDLSSHDLIITASYKE